MQKKSAETQVHNTDIVETQKTVPSIRQYMSNFCKDIKSNICTPCISTGFDVLDKNLGGGLYEGLCVVGAISSLGKTTLVLQIADQIAKSGIDVLYFSLEMSRYEMMAKSVSRITIQNVIENNSDLMLAKSSLDISCGSRYESYTDEEKQAIAFAINAYNEYNENLYIYEGVGDMSVKDVRDIVKTHIKDTGRKPIVIVDYLQILAPCSIGLTDKQVVDKSVLELKRLSRDISMPVIGISSFSRSNYKEPVSMGSFKESGAIEYSADVLIGLQFAGVGKSDFNVNKAKQANPRQIEVVILKNRKSETGQTLNMEYYPKYNYFQEV